MNAFEVLDLSPQQYIVLFACGAALLAMWLHLRFPSSGPQEVPGVTAHLVVAVVAANLLVPTAFRLASSVPDMLIATFGVALPATVYMFVSGIWLIRLGQGYLRRYSQ